MYIYTYVYIKYIYIFTYTQSSRIVKRPILFEVYISRGNLLVTIFAIKRDLST